MGVPTELVIYPGQFHGIKPPSYILDRYQRYLDWFAKYLALRVESGLAATGFL